jgi:hypothetical protein
MSLRGLPYPLIKVVNAGCKLQLSEPIAWAPELVVSSQLLSVEQDERRALCTVRVQTGPASSPKALQADLVTHVPLANTTTTRKRAPRERAAKLVPRAARELAYTRFARDFGLGYAKLTGDFNPIHWFAPYAKMMGFRSVILHGFASLSWAYETALRTVFSGDVTRVSEFEMRFTRPLPLPASAGLYHGEVRSLFLGDAPGGRAYAIGAYQPTPSE